MAGRTRDDELTNEEARRAVANAKNHRDEGEFPEAAGWYRRAAKLLLEDGEEDRAIEYARLAADLDDLADVEAGTSRKQEEPKPKPKAKSGATGRQKAASTMTAELQAARAKAEAAAKPKARADSTGKHKAMRDTAPQPVASNALRASTLHGVGAAPASAPPRNPSSSAPTSAKPLASNPAPSSAKPLASNPAPSPAKPLASNPPPASPKLVAPPPPRTAIPMPRMPPPPQAPRSANPPARTAAPSQPVRAPVANSAQPLPRAPSSPPPRPPAKPALPERSPPSAPPPPRAPAVGMPASTWTIPPPAPRAQRIDYVRARLPTFPGFDEFSTERLREIARQVQVLECDDGEFLFDAGAPPGPMFLITSGSASVHTDDDAAMKVTLREDAAVGVLSALHGERRLARARARGPLEAFVVAPSLARALAAESAVLRNFFDGVVRERVLALLPHVSRTLARMERAACMRLLELCEVLSVADGTLLQLEGVAARSLYLVAVGEAEIFGEPIAARIVQRAGAGDLIGAESLRDDTAARSTVRASRPMMVARLSRANYRRFAAEHSAAAQLLRETERE